MKYWLAIITVYNTLAFLAVYYFGKSWLKSAEEMIGILDKKYKTIKGMENGLDWVLKGE